jgi:hypothetical protein
MVSDTRQASSEDPAEFMAMPCANLPLIRSTSIVPSFVRNVPQALPARLACGPLQLTEPLFPLKTAEICGHGSAPATPTLEIATPAANKPTNFLIAVFMSDSLFIVRAHARRTFAHSTRTPREPVLRRPATGTRTSASCVPHFARTLTRQFD